MGKPNWIILEEDIAKDLSGRRTVASGAKPIDKSDVRGQGYYVEAKHTSSNKYILSREGLVVHFRRAMANNSIPVFIIRFGHSADYMVILIEGISQVATQKTLTIRSSQSHTEIFENILQKFGIETNILDRKAFVRSCV